MYPKKKAVVARFLLSMAIAGVLSPAIPRVLAQDAIIVDHNAVRRFDEIPDQCLEAARQLTMHYCSTSHGVQIISGLAYIEEHIDAVKYSVAYELYYTQPIDPCLPPQEDPPAHRICHRGFTPDEYWATEEGRDETRRFAASGLFDFSMFGWCGELSWHETDYVSDYLSTLDLFEQEYPNMRFIYMTGRADGYGPYSHTRENNNQIRDYCGDNNKVLYDYADIENWDPDGNFYENNSDCSWCEDWCNSHPEECVGLMPECEDWVHPGCCPHSHGYNCFIKGKAYWFMMARLAGWDGACSPDFDGDGDVDLADLAHLLSNYGTASGMLCEDGDLDGDGDIDLADLAELLGHYS